MTGGGGVFVVDGLGAVGTVFEASTGWRVGKRGG